MRYSGVFDLYSERTDEYAGRKGRRYSQMDLSSVGRTFGSRYERVGTAIGNLLKLNQTFPFLVPTLLTISVSPLHSCERLLAAIRSLASILLSIDMLNMIGMPVITVLNLSRSPLSLDSCKYDTAFSGLKIARTILNTTTTSCSKCLGHHTHDFDDTTSY